MGVFVVCCLGMFMGCCVGMFMGYWVGIFSERHLAYGRWKLREE